MTAEHINANELLELPVELQCQIISQITEPAEIRRLTDLSSHLRQLTRDCITRIRRRKPAYPFTELLRVPFILRFSNLRVVNDPIDIETEGDLILLANLHHLREANFIFENIYRISMDFIPGIKISNFSAEMMRAWIISFIHQYCLGYRIQSDGSIDRNSRKLEPASFEFWSDHFPMGSDFCRIHLYRGVLHLDSGADFDLDWLGSVIEAMHQHNSMTGLVISNPISSDLIASLLEMPEFHIIVITSLESELLYGDSVRTFLQANKIDFLREEPLNFTQEFAIDDDTKLLLELSASNPLRIVDLPVKITALPQIVDTLKSLELIGAAIPSPAWYKFLENRENEEDISLVEATSIVKTVLEEHPRLKIKLFIPGNQEELIDQFMHIYAGPHDRLLAPD